MHGMISVSLLTGLDEKPFVSVSLFTKIIINVQSRMLVDGGLY